MRQALTQVLTLCDTDSTCSSKPAWHAHWLCLHGTACDTLPVARIRRSSTKMLLSSKTKPNSRLYVSSKACRAPGLQ